MKPESGTGFRRIRVPAWPEYALRLLQRRQAALLQHTPGDLLMVVCLDDGYRLLDPLYVDGGRGNGRSRARSRLRWGRCRYGQNGRRLERHKEAADQDDTSQPASASRRIRSPDTSRRLLHAPSSATLGHRSPVVTVPPCQHDSQYRAFETSSIRKRARWLRMQMPRQALRFRSSCRLGVWLSGQVRPELNNGSKTHYQFDRNGNYTGSW